MPKSIEDIDRQIAALKEQKKRMERWKTEKNIKQQFNQILWENRKTDKEIQSIYEFYKNGRYSYGHKKLYCKIVSSYLKDNFAGTAKKPKRKLCIFLSWQKICTRTNAWSYRRLLN